MTDTGARGAGPAAQGSIRGQSDPPAGGGGRSPQGKLFVAGAVELSPAGKPRRIRLAPIADFSAATLTPYVAAVAALGARLVTDVWSGYARLSDHLHEAKVVGQMAPHVVLKWTHRLFSKFKRWGLGVYPDLRRQHVRRYVDEFVFRWNGRHMATAFDNLLGIGARLAPATARDFVERRA